MLEKGIILKWSPYFGFIQKTTFLKKIQKRNKKYEKAIAFSFYLWYNTTVCRA
jgi:hypothetical protein